MQACRDHLLCHQRSHGLPFRTDLCGDGGRLPTGRVILQLHPSGTPLSPMTLLPTPGKGHAALQRPRGLLQMLEKQRRILLIVPGAADLHSPE